MLLTRKVNPDVIPKIWDVIKEAVKVGLPPTVAHDEDALSYVLANLVQDSMQLWMMYDDEDENIEPKALGITHIAGEPGIKYKNLVVFAIVAFAQIPMNAWKLAFDVIRDFAKRNDCKKIVGFTNVPRVVEIVKSVGGQAEYVVLTMEV